MGGSVQAIEGWYRRRGLERTESFHDLPDHVALQLEFVARLFAGAAAARQAGDDAEARQLEAEARAFLGAFVVHWLPGFCAALERTLAQHRLPAPYLYLAHILCAAVECDATAGVPHAAVAPVTSMVTPIAANGPTPAQLQEIARALAAHGHLGVRWRRRARWRRSARRIAYAGARVAKLFRKWALIFGSTPPDLEALSRDPARRARPGAR